MPFPIVKCPYYICGSAEKKFTPGTAQGERLTRCVGCDFVVNFYREGISLVDGHDTLADWVKEPALREPLTHCNACACASGKRYFHQSCLGREQAGALSYDNNYFHVRGATADQQHEELRNISHKLCGECLRSAHRVAPDEHRLQHLKYEGVIDEEAAALKKLRADRRGLRRGLRRAQLEQLLTKLEADGTSSIAIFTTRPLNRRVLASSAADGLLTSIPGLNKVVLDVMKMQADGLRDGQARTAAPDQAQCQPFSVAAPELEASTTGQAAQQSTTRQPLSVQEADADLVSRWKGFRLLHKATNAELKGYLERRGLPYYASSKSALLARVAADLIKNHPDGGLEPPSASATVTTTASASEQPQQRRQKRAKVSKNTEVQQQAAMSIADQVEPRMAH